MVTRRILLAVLAWIGVVAVTSAVAWATINAAGQRVLSPAETLPPVEAPALVPSSDAESRLPSPRTTPTKRPPRTSSPPRTKSPKPPETDAPRTGASDPEPTGPSSPTPDGGTTSRPPDGEPEPSPRRDPDPSPRRDRSGGDIERRTWQGAAGSVTVRCDGSRVSLQSATPNNGYSVEIRERGPEEVEVRFEGDEREVDVEASCDDGTLEFSADD